jgi:hypothetical protein
MFKRSHTFFKMKHFLFLFLTIFCCVFVSCKKDIVAPPLPEFPINYLNYSQLKVGNYWIYQRYNINEFGEAQATQVFDSCYVSNDTIINGMTYYRIVRPGTVYANMGTYWRDSLHYIVNSSGDKLFSSTDFSSTFSSNYIVVGLGDTVAHQTLKMEDKDFTVSTPAGVFVTSNARITYHLYPGYDDFGTELRAHARYAENIGLVLESALPFLGSLSTHERRLVRYHLEN